MRYIYLSILILSCFLITNKVLSEQMAEHYIAPIVTVATTTPKVVHYTRKSPTATQLALINKYAEHYNVSATLMTQIIECESGFNEQARGDGGQSRGLVQIYAPAHPEITWEQATNPEFAIDFLASNLSLGNGNMWTCYRLISSR